MDESQVANRGATQLRILFRLRGLQELGGIAREEERLENLPANIRGSFCLVQLLQFARAVDQAELTDGLAARGIHFGKCLARFSATEDSQIFDRFALQLGIALPACDSSKNLAGLRRAVLRHDEERLGFF